MWAILVFQSGDSSTGMASSSRGSGGSLTNNDVLSTALPSQARLPPMPSSLLPPSDSLKGLPADTNRIPAAVLNNSMNNIFTHPPHHQVRFEFAYTRSTGSVAILYTVLFFSFFFLTFASQNPYEYFYVYRNVFPTHVHKYNRSRTEDNERKPTLETVERNQSQEPERAQLVWVLNISGTVIPSTVPIIPAFRYKVLWS